MAAVSAAAYRQRGEREQAARDLATSGGARNSFRTLLGDAEADAVAVRGTKVTDLLQGQAQYVAMTGDLAGARANARTMATAARGTGASESAIAATMATFSTKFGISSPEQMQAALGIMNASGKAGAFEMGDAARYFQEMGAAGSRFGLDKGVAGVSKLTAMAQIARMSTGSGAEASTGVQAMLRQLTAKSADIKAMNKGKEVVFADKGKTKTNDIVDVLVGTLRASKGNQVKLTKVFGDEGMKGASEFIKRFNEAGAALGPAATEAQKLAAGEQAVRDAFTQLSGAAGTWSDVVADAATRTDTASARLTTAWEEAVTKVGSAVAPGVNELSKHFDVLIGPLTSMAQEVGTTTGSLANLVAYLKRYGLIGPDPSAAGDDPGAKINRLAAVDKRLAELDKPDAKLTTKQQAEKRALLTEQRDLRIETGVDDVHARLNAKYDRKLGQTPTQKLYDTSDPLGIFAGSPDRDVSQLQSQDQIAPQRGLLGELWETNMAPVRAFQALGGAAGTSNANADAGARAFEGSNRGLQEAARALIEAAGELKTGVRTGVPDPAGGLGGRPYP
ncbi:MAG: phage tail tape measure protein [Polyangiaceae bacterium]|nr:phage tail tape measure protein [Polyangiaceae bacterium]